MTLELEKLTPELEKMATTVARRRQNQQQNARDLHQALDRFATNWSAINNALIMAQNHADEKYYRSARPLDNPEPLNAAYPPSPCPPEATIIATDGSQILPDRHAAYLYYLVNVGAIIYHHGTDRDPVVTSRPRLYYANEMAEGDEEPVDDETDWQPRQYEVTVERDRVEISTLAELVEERDGRQMLVGHTPTLAILDQRLLYWPFGGTDAVGRDAMKKWSQEMTKIRHSGAWLAGYIDRPGKMTVVTLLQSLLAGPDFDWKSLGKRGASTLITDADLFADILQPGERSAVFVEVSPSNERFAELDPKNEVCFFFINPGQTGQQIARVDIPMWVAENPAAVEAVHALVYEQCQILGDYPYVLARADELAVVGRRDQSELDLMIDIFMQRVGVSGQLTAKQSSKEIARGGRSRHMGLRV